MRTVQMTLDEDLVRTDGIGRECAVNCDHLQTVAKGRIGSLLARLSIGRMREIRAAFNFALVLNE